MATTRQPFIARHGLTVSLGDVRFNGTSFMKVPVGTTAQRPSAGEDGMIRYNSDLQAFEAWVRGAQRDLLITARDLNAATEEGIVYALIF